MGSSGCPTTLPGQVQKRQRLVPDEEQPIPSREALDYTHRDYLTEGRSTGIPKMLIAMRSNGSPLPEFQTDDDR